MKELMVCYMSREKPIKADPLSTYEQGSRVVALARDPASSAVASSTPDGAVHVWNAGTGKLVRHLEGRAPGGKEKRSTVRCIGYCLPRTKDARWLACGTSSGDVEIYNADTGKLARLFKGMECGSVNAISIPESGNFIVFGGNGVNATGYVKIWDVKASRIVREIKAHGLDVSGLSAANDDSSIISCGFGPDIKAWDLHTGRLADTIRVGVVDRKPASLGMDEATREMARRLLPDAMEAFEGSLGGVQAVASVHPSYGHMVACLEHDVSIIIGMEGGQTHMKTITGGVATIVGYAYNKAVTGTSKGEIAGWDLATGRKEFTFQGHDKAITAITMTQPDSVVSGDEGGRLHAWLVPFADIN